MPLTKSLPGTVAQVGVISIGRAASMITCTWAQVRPCESW
jgi:hypothetical protein